MKSINKKLFATSGLFVALCGLTSFNPFTEATHLASLDKEQSISLSAQLPQGRDAGRSDSAQAQGKNDSALQAKINAGIAGKNKTTEADDAKAVQTSEGTACTDGKCEGKEKISQTESLEAINAKLAKNCEIKIAEESKVLDAKVAKLSDEEKTKQANTIASIRQKFEAAKILCAEVNSDNKESKEDLTLDDNENICAEGDYKERIKCFGLINKSYAKKSNRASNEDKNRLATDISELIAEINGDDLSAREKSKLLRSIDKVISQRGGIDSKDKRDLQQDVRIATQQIDARKQDAVFAQRLDMHASGIEQIDRQIYELSSYPGAQFQMNMLQIQRKNMVINMERDIVGYRENIRRSLPRSTDNDSVLVTQIRDQRSNDFQELISPVAGAITDQRITSLDTTLSGAPGSAAQNGEVFSSEDGRYRTLPAGQSSYDSVNPGELFAGAPISALRGMSPAQQIQYRQQNGLGGYQQTALNSTYGNNYSTTYNNMPNQQSGPRTGRPTYNSW